LFLFSLVGFCGLVGAGYVLAEIPLPAELPRAETTFFTDINGNRLASLDGGEDRVTVRLEQVPQVVIDAVLAAEDRNFYAHRGIDPVGLVRATWNDLRGRTLQGGSTITQQYVKNTFVGDERTLGRKLREATLAVKLERKLGKDEILERYLNTIYLGRGAYGVQAAARAWFGQDVGGLGLVEAAYLAALIRAPERADVSIEAQRETGVARFARTLAAMVRAGSITAAQRDEAGPSAWTERVVPRQAQESSVAMAEKGTEYFVEHVRRELVARYGDAAVTAQGLRVRTTLDLELQRKAYDAVYGLLDRPDDPAAALVAIDDQGQVRAMVGGRGYAVGDPHSRVNLATGRDGGGTGRQAGSAFKPFVLAALARDGYSVESVFRAPAEITMPKANAGADYKVANYEGQDFGEAISLIDATVNSVNTVYAQAQLAIGAQKAVAMAAAAGITSPLAPNASLALGTSEVSVLELAGAYSTFANRGVRITPRVILEVTTADGRVLQPAADPAADRVMSAEAADIVTYCLQQAVARGTGTGAQVPGRQVAGKTGTTQDHGDAWFAGYT
ncbi:MAG: transglycosylase domain-containing protein, partial [Acidimicrobiales bacterium]